VAREELLLEVPSELDTLPAEVDAALEADDVLSAQAAGVAKARAVNSAVVQESAVKWVMGAVG
jgi:hypothetical protein